jgi:hypothetical protein
MLRALNMAGWSGWVLLLIGIVGAIASVACVVLIAARSSDARARASGLLLATIPMLFATAAFGLGVLGLAIGRQRVHAALAGVDMPSVTEAILHEGYLETLYSLRIGLVAGALPFVLGVAGVGIGLARRKPGDASRAMMPPLVAGVLAIGAAAACFVIEARPLPGRDFSNAEPGERDLYDAAILIPGGQIDLGCLKLVNVVRDRAEFRKIFDDGSMRTAPLPPIDAIVKLAPTFLSLTDQCAQRIVAAIAADPKDVNTPRRLADFRVLSAGVALDVRTPLYQRIDALFAPPSDDAFGNGGLGLSGVGEPSGPTGPSPGAVSVPYSPFTSSGSGISLGSIGTVPLKGPKIHERHTIVVGRLPPEVVQRIVRQHYGQVRRCYEDGLKRNPKLTGTVVTTFVIGSDGTIGNVAEGAGTDLPDAAVRACVVSGFKKLVFPSPESGTVTVTFPITLEPAE